MVIDIPAWLAALIVLLTFAYAFRNTTIIVENEHEES